MEKYFVCHGIYNSWFVCWADDAAHAKEQCEDAYPGEEIHVIYKGEIVEA